MPSVSLDCPYCGAPLASGVTQCPNCLNEIEAAAPAPEPTPVIQQAPQQIVEEETPDYLKPQPSTLQADWKYVSIFGKYLALPLVLILLVFNYVIPEAHKVGEQNQQSKSSDRLTALGAAAHKYADAHNGQLPPTTTVQEFRDALAPYLTDGKKADPYMQPGTTAYYWINPAVSNKKLNSIAKADETELAEETMPEPTGQLGILYVDGHVHYAPKSGAPTN